MRKSIHWEKVGDVYYGTAGTQQFRIYPVHPSGLYNLIIVFPDGAQHVAESGIASECVAMVRACDYVLPVTSFTVPVGMIVMLSAFLLWILSHADV